MGFFEPFCMHWWKAYSHPVSCEIGFSVSWLQRIFSIILQGLVYANCRFLALDTGGKQSDAGVLKDSSFY